MSIALMRAVVASEPGGPEVLECVQLPRPDPGEGQVRIKVEICGLNPLDLQARRGNAPWLIQSWPAVLGIEHSGIVDAVGAGVSENWLGMRVTSTMVLGGNAEYSVVPLASIKPVPDGIDLATGALYRGACHTAWRVLELFGPGQGSDSWILVHSAAGTIGPVLCQLAKARGLRVCGIVGSQGKVDFASSFGFDALIVSTGDDWVEPVREATGGAPAIALAVDGNSGPGGLRNFEVLAPMGTCVIIGASSGSHSPAIEPRSLIANNHRLAGFNLPQVEALLGDVERVDAKIVAMLREGTLRMPITGAASLEALPDLHRSFEARELMGRTLISITDE